MSLRAFLQNLSSQHETNLIYNNFFVHFCSIQIISLDFISFYMGKTSTSELHYLTFAFIIQIWTNRLFLGWRVLLILLRFAAYRKWWVAFLCMLVEQVSLFIQHILLRFLWFCVFYYLQVIESINKCDVDIRRELFSSILVRCQAHSSNMWIHFSRIDRVWKK